MIYLELSMLAVIVVFVVDTSGFIDTIKKWLGKWLGKSVSTLRPFDCSLCMVWWAGILFAMIRREFNLPVITYVCALSALAYPISQIISLVQSLIIRGCNKLADILGL